MFGLMCTYSSYKASSATDLYLKEHDHLLRYCISQCLLMKLSQYVVNDVSSLIGVNCCMDAFYHSSSTVHVLYLGVYV